MRFAKSLRARDGEVDALNFARLINMGSCYLHLRPQVGQKEKMGKGRLMALSLQRVDHSTAVRRVRLWVSFKR